MADKNDKPAAQEAQQAEQEGKTFEEQLAMLDSMIDKMQDPNTSLDESFESYKTGMSLVQNLNDMIDRMEKEVIVISGTEDAAKTDDEDEE